MKRSAKPYDEKDVIVIDDETPYVASPPPPQQQQLQQEQPVKKVKKEEPADEDAVPPPPPARASFDLLNQLQAKITEMEQNCESSLARAEAAEEKNKVLQLEFKQKMDEAAKLCKKNMEEFKGRLAETSKQLEEAKSEAAKREEEWKEKVNSLAKQLETEKGKVLDLINDRIDELSVKLPPHGEDAEQQQQHDVTAEDVQQQQGAPKKEQQQSQSQPDNSQTQPPPLQQEPQLGAKNWETVPDATNLFQLCRPDAPGTISFGLAIAKLQPRFSKSMRLFLRSSAYFKKERLFCPVCDSLLKKFHVLEHFFSLHHGKKFRANGAALSFAAFKYWREKLVDAVPYMLKELGAAAPAASSAAGEDKEEDDEEEQEQ